MHWLRDPERRAERFVASGDEHAAQGRFREAAIEYRNALKHRPGDAGTEFKLGTAHDVLGERARAHQAFVRVTELDGRWTDAGIRVAKVLLAEARFADAQRHLETVLGHEPRNVTALVLLGGVYAGLGEQTSALAWVEQALAIDPESANAHILLGSIRLSAGEQEEGGTAFAKATQLAPDSLEVWTALGQFRWALGEFEATERALTPRAGGRP